ncbi:MAG: anti-sigma factor antagonist, partial [Thermoleophilaceae bacterium]|nr:anti-sigma factor antagonist [Thermoleophilaceae bacterium]
MAAPVNFVLSERTLDGGGSLLSLEGETTSAAGERLRKRVVELIGRRVGTVIVDLSRISFIDSSVVEGLAQGARTAKKRGSRLLVVEPVDPMVARLLEMGRLDLVAEVVSTLEGAAKAINMAPGTLQSALPPPVPTDEENQRRRALFGRKQGQKEILQELGSLRRLAQELRRETGVYEKPSPEEIDRRRAAESALLQARENELRAQVTTESGALDAAEFRKARTELTSSQRPNANPEPPADPPGPPPAANGPPASEPAGDAPSPDDERVQALETALGAARAERDRMGVEVEQGHARIQALEGDLQAAREAADSVRVDLTRART